MKPFPIAHHRLHRMLLVGGMAFAAGWWSAGPDGFWPRHWRTAWAGMACLIVAIAWGWLHAERHRLANAHWPDTLSRAHIGVARWFLDTDQMHLSSLWLTLVGPVGGLTIQPSPLVWLQIHEDDRAFVRDALLTLSCSHPDVGPMALRVQPTTLGGWTWLECHAMLDQLTPSGQPLRITLTVRDITQQRINGDRQRLYTTLFEHLPEALLITDGQFQALDFNARLAAVLGCSRDESLGCVPVWLKPLLDPGAHNTLSADLLAHGTWQGEIQARNAAGRALVFHGTACATSELGELRLCAFVLSDVTEKRQHQAELARQARFDELTGLPNRLSLGTLLREAIQASEREGFLLTICSFDIDHFKVLNDQLGHAVGDALLTAVSQRLSKIIAMPQDQLPSVARLGGDEFVLLLRSATLEQSRRVVERVLRGVALPFQLAQIDTPVHITGSIGATVYPIDSADADTLLRHADHAMYRAKQTGRNGYLFFDAELDKRKEAHFEALARVQHALTDEQFVLYFQPKVNMRLNKVLGVEALLRWKHPRHGVIPPAQFLPLIEPTPLSEEVGAWVLEKGIDQLAEWQRMGLDLTLSINVSARHLQAPTFKQRLSDHLARHPSAVARSLILEVLETAALANIDYTSQLMEECKAFGIRFALDDFGTGYSTLTYLKRLPLDLLKIDRSFVHNMLNDNQDMAIVQGVIGLSQTFGCVVVAEGVESAEQASQLIAAGCEIGQGNGIAKAMPAEEVPLWIKNYRGVVGLTGPA